MEFDEGRVAVFGETGAFTSQIQRGTNLIGFSNPKGNENEEFVLSTLRWLAGYKP